MSTLTLTGTEQSNFDRLMKQSYKKVYSLAYRLSGNRVDAEDLTQEAFFRAYRGFREFEGDRPFENWIFRILTRLFLDLVRSRKRRIQAMSFDAPLRVDGGDDSVGLDVADRRMNAEDVIMQSAVSEPLEQALNQLKPDQRALVLLADVEGVPYNDIAAMFGIPVGTVRSRLHRAHKQLRATLEKSPANKAKVPGRLCLAG
ncbi:MAG TPA: sigma-70 family RNA polymerase sigma factor [Fimbriimonadaceae bacterium]|nr:sigma-70 family RNA polymerase sigma factor [Fimbriimonadaceae bacterium]HRJ33372.1 sigma-70 family RNA polymerase sigma factor [Fimbriimonadaceae bacterium]